MDREFYEKYKKDIKNCFNDLKKGKIKKQIPNMLTASRLFAPLFIVPAAFSGNIVLAAAFTFLFQLTDFVDGYAARKLDAVSEFGKDLDPIVDKIFATTISIPVIFVNPLMLLNIIGEAVIGKINTKSKAKGNVPRTTLLGKFKTLLMGVSLVGAYTSIATNIIDPIIINVLLGATLLTQAVTAKQYYDIDKEKDGAKLINEENKIPEIKENIEETKFEKIKRYSRSNEIADLKKLKDELLHKEEHVHEVDKVKKKDR